MSHTAGVTVGSRVSTMSRAQKTLPFLLYLFLPWWVPYPIGHTVLGNLWICEHSKAPILGRTCVKMCVNGKMVGEIKGGEWDPKFCISLPLNRKLHF